MKLFGTITMVAGDAKGNDAKSAKISVIMGAIAGANIGMAMSHDNSLKGMLKAAVLGAAAGACTGCVAAAIVKIAVADVLASNSIPKPEV